MDGGIFSHRKHPPKKVKSAVTGLAWPMPFLKKSGTKYAILTLIPIVALAVSGFMPMFSKQSGHLAAPLQISQLTGGKVNHSGTMSGVVAGHHKNNSGQKQPQDAQELVLVAKEGQKVPR